jgi:hypothetical protein
LFLGTETVELELFGLSHSVFFDIELGFFFFNYFTCSYLFVCLFISWY